MYIQLMSWIELQLVSSTLRYNDNLFSVYYEGIR